eukprot:5719493-Prymnesium_polylepis.1
MAPRIAAIRLAICTQRDERCTSLFLVLLVHEDQGLLQAEGVGALPQTVGAVKVCTTAADQT